MLWLREPRDLCTFGDQLCALSVDSHHPSAAAHHLEVLASHAMQLPAVPSDRELREWIERVRRGWVRPCSHSTD